MQKVITAGVPFQQTPVNSSDTASTLAGLLSLSDLYKDSPRGDILPRYALVAVEDASIRISLGGTATTSAGIKFNDGDIFKLEANEIWEASIISAVAGSHATLQVTLEY